MKPDQDLCNLTNELVAVIHSLDDNGEMTDETLHLLSTLEGELPARVDAVCRVISNLNMRETALRNEAAKFGASAENAASLANASAQNEAAKFEATSQNISASDFAKNVNANVANMMDQSMKIAVANADAATKIELQNIDAQTRKDLAATEATYKNAMQASASANEIFQQTTKNIADIMANPDLDTAAKQKAVDAQKSYLQGSMKILSANSSIPGLSELITF